MVDMFLRIVGIALIQAIVQTVCLVSGALFVLAVARITSKEKPMGCGCGGGTGWRSG